MQSARARTYLREKRALGRAGVMNAAMVVQMDVVGNAGWWDVYARREPLPLNRSWTPGSDRGFGHDLPWVRPRPATRAKQVFIMEEGAGLIVCSVLDGWCAG